MIPPRPSITSEVLGRSDLVLLLGESGSGKSAALASVAAEHPAWLVEARALDHRGTLEERLSRWASTELDLELDADAVATRLRSGELRLLLDGVDELPTSRQCDVTRIAVASMDSGTFRNGLIASRALPAGERLADRMTLAYTRPLDAPAVTGMVRALLDCPADTLRGVCDHIVQFGGGNPLIVELMVDEFKATSHLCRRRIDLLHRIVNRMIMRVGVTGGPLVVLDACSRLAFEVLRTDALGLSETRAREVLAPDGAECALEALFVLESTVGSPLLRRIGAGTVDFRHRLLAEFLAALALRDDLAALGAIAGLGNAPDALGFALNMSEDPANSLTAVGERLGVQALAQLAPYLATLPVGALNRAHATISGRLRRALTAEEPRAGDWPIYDEEASEESFEATPVDTARGWSQLLVDQWGSLADRWEGPQSQDVRQARGREFEEFMAAFFDEFFHVARRNVVVTAEYEIDLVLEIISSDQFWRQHGSDIYVECKNERAKTDADPIRKFLDLHRGRRTQLGFFVSRAGFTRAGIVRIRATATDRTEMLLVPLTGAQIAQTLRDREQPGRFFKRVTRNAMQGSS